MYYVMTERESLVTFLPPGGVGAEIGVARGDFSEVLLDRARPARLHLIDPWSHLEATDRDPRAYLDEIARAERFFSPPTTNMGSSNIAPCVSALPVVRRW